MRRSTRFGATPSAPESGVQSDYQRGFENGLVEGYRSALSDGGSASANSAFSQRRTFLAWSTLLLGLGSAVGAVVARRDNELFTVVAVAGGVMTAVIGAAQVLTDETVPGPLGIR